MSGGPVQIDVNEEARKEREIETNKQQALAVAAELFKFISNPVIVEQTTPEQRHEACIEKLKSFAQAFPLVLKKMTWDLLYDDKAFRKFLDKLHRDPGKGMEGHIERQADYAKYLYQELCRRKGKHYDQKQAQRIWRMEYDQMYDWMKKTKKAEEAAKSELEEEAKKQLEERRNELLNFVNEVSPSGDVPANMDELIQQDQEYLAMLRTTSEPESPPPLASGEFNQPEPVVIQQPLAPEKEDPVADAKIRAVLAAAAKPVPDDWLQDSNVATWKKTKAKAKKK